MPPRLARIQEEEPSGRRSPRRGAQDDAGLDLYIREVERQPPLSVEEEDRLIRRLRRGDREARETLVQRSLRLVPAVGRQFVDRGLSLLQLIERGNLGLLGAVEAYEGGEQTLPFYVYAAEQIERAMAALVRSGGAVQ